MIGFLPAKKAVIARIACRFALLYREQRRLSDHVRFCVLVVENANSFDLEN